MPAARQGDLFAGQTRSFRPPGADDDRIGVVDVGSNSVRMVVFEGARRCPSVVFNEKTLCGLGAELERTGRLAPEGCERAMRALHRFVALAPGLRVGALAGVATAAVREASDGEAFRERVEAETGIRLEIASGADEARLAARGVLFGDPAARGLVVDLGGASMEFCPVGDGRPGKGMTTPLGPLRLGALGDRRRLAGVIDSALAPVARRFRGDARRLYLVGGAWRALGRVQIHRVGHPLNVLHEYSFSPEDALITTHLILTQGVEFLGAIPEIPSGRVASLPHAALLLEALVEHLGPETLSISGFGLREGVCFDYMPPKIRRLDPLISTCAGQERTRARADGFGAELARWIVKGIAIEDAAERRLVLAACHLSDVCWRALPDFRAAACIEAVTRVNVSGAGHRGRAFVAAMLLCRYRSGRNALADEPAMALLSGAERDRAVEIGALMRLGCTIAGVMPGVLPHVAMELGEGRLSLRPSAGAQILMGEEVDRRLGQAARLLGVAPCIVAPG